MKIFYDTEFLEDGRTIDLISIGMIAEDGRELYHVSEDIAEGELYRRIIGHQWLMENVVPHLPLKAPKGVKTHMWSPPGSTGVSFFSLDMASNVVASRRYIRNAVREFIQATPDAELWAWYAAYDHVALAQLFGRMINLPEGVPMWTNDLKQEVTRLGNPTLAKQDTAEHHALADARWLKAAAESLPQYAPGETDPTAPVVSE